jgi:hypothetical protein
MTAMTRVFFGQILSSARVPAEREIKTKSGAFWVQGYKWTRIKANTCWEWAFQSPVGEVVGTEGALFRDVVQEILWDSTAGTARVSLVSDALERLQIKPVEHLLGFVRDNDTVVHNPRSRSYSSSGFTRPAEMSLRPRSSEARVSEPSGGPSSSEAWRRSSSQWRASSA